MSFGDTTSTGMSSLTGNQNSARSVSAFFDSREHADAARRDLMAAGIPDSAITVTEGSRNPDTASRTGTSAYHEEGFWESLKELFMPEEDRYSYAEGLRRGGYLLTVRTDTSNYDRVVDILDRDGAVNLDERESSWRNEGWTGYTGRDASAESEASYVPPSAATAGFGASDADRMPLRDSLSRERSGAGAADTAYVGSAPGLGVAGSGDRTRSMGTEETIPVVEEDVRIGKRDVSHGRVRVRSYVVETPVSEEVNLRSENVQVERRPVDRPATEGDRLFQDRTIEAEQYAEEAVVQKEARVKEEIALRKNVEQHTETVSDKVRRTEVEVQDERGNTISSTDPATTRKI